MAFVECQAGSEQMHLRVQAKPEFQIMFPQYIDKEPTGLNILTCTPVFGPPKKQLGCLRPLPEEILNQPGKINECQSLRILCCSGTSRATQVVLRKNQGHTQQTWVFQSYTQGWMLSSRELGSIRFYRSNRHQEHPGIISLTPSSI